MKAFPSLPHAARVPLAAVVIWFALAVTAERAHAVTPQPEVGAALLAEAGAGVLDRPLAVQGEAV